MKIAPCPCCKMPPPKPSRERRSGGDAELINEAVAQRAQFKRAAEADYEAIAIHEAAHCIAAAVQGHLVIYATVGGETPNVRLQRREEKNFPILADLIWLTAGSIAEAFALHQFTRPYPSDLFRDVARARAGRVGHCDRCEEAKLLVSKFANRSNDELVDTWLSAFQVTTILFEQPTWRKNLRTVADALHDLVFLDFYNLEALIDVDSLQAEQAAVLADVDMNAPETWGRI